MTFELNLVQPLLLYITYHGTTATPIHWWVSMTTFPNKGRVNSWHRDWMANCLKYLSNISRNSLLAPILGYNVKVLKIMLVIKLWLCKVQIKLVAKLALYCPFLTLESFVPLLRLGAFQVTVGLKLCENTGLLWVSLFSVWQDRVYLLKFCLITNTVPQQKGEMNYWGPEAPIKSKLSLQKILVKEE